MQSPQAVQGIHPGARPFERFVRPRRLGGSGPFGATVEKAWLKQTGRESRVTLTKGVSDRRFPAARQLEPRRDVHHQGYERAPLMKCSGEIRLTLNVTPLTFSQYPGNGFELDIARFIDE
jgi:hypothetical protein